MPESALIDEGVLVPTDQKLDWGGRQPAELERPDAPSRGQVYRGVDTKPPADYRDIWVVLDDTGEPVDIRVHSVRRKGFVSMLPSDTEES